MNSGKKSTFLLSFLDVLSNALAAVFILAMVRLQPAPPGLSSGELYYIKATGESSAIDSTLMIAIKLKTTEKMLHEQKDYLRSDSRLIVTERWSKVLFLKEPKQQNFEEVICYLSDPNFSKNMGEECVVIQIKLPNRKIEKTFSLNKENDYRTHIYINGKLNEETFIDCNSIVSFSQ
jgi:hypothetical protein